MTCIVAIRDGDYVYMGGDSFLGHAGKAGTMSTPKLFKKGSLLIGAAGSSKLIEIFEDQFQNIDDKLLDGIERNLIMDEIKRIYKHYGLYKDGKGLLDDGAALIAYKNKIFFFQNYDFSLTEVSNYYAIGSGEQYALGSIYTSYMMNQEMAWNNKISIKIENIIITALCAASLLCPTVSGPFIILSTKNEK